MYFLAPRDIYGSECFRIFVDELGGPKAICRYLKVTERTVYRWLSTGNAPRAAVLALFWESKYGRSHIYTDQVNEIRLLYRQVCLLREQFQRAKDLVTGLRAMDAGSANEPLFENLPDFGPLLEPSLGAGIPLPLPTTPKPPREIATGTMHASPPARVAMQAFERNRQAPRT